MGALKLGLSGLVVSVCLFWNATVPAAQGDADVETEPTAHNAAGAAASQPSDDVAQMNALHQGASQSRKATPTAIGNKGGATPQTENLPLEKDRLAELRRKQLGQPEFRGAWVTRFEWTSPDPAKLRSNIVHIMDTAKAAGKRQDRTAG